MIFENTEVISNIDLGAEYCRLGIRCNRTYHAAVPGQFVMVRLPGQQTPLLSRPFSIHRLVEPEGRFQGIEILFKIIGSATRKFAELNPGDKVNLLGPIGKGFSPPPPGRPFWLVAGGIGVAPLVFLAGFLKSQGVDPSLGRVFLGGRTAGDVLCVDAFEQAGMPVDVSTDDGSMGARGLVTESLSRAFCDPVPSMIYACGPEPMLRAVSDIARARGIPCQVSVETVMACGMGACLGCAVEARDNNSERFSHVCIDGPVFPIDAIRL